MNLDQARLAARYPLTYSRAELALALDTAVREIDRMEALADEAKRLTTLGGIPPAVDYEWANERHVPPPASASDPAAPRLIRTAGAT